MEEGINTVTGMVMKVLPSRSGGCVSALGLFATRARGLAAHGGGSFSPSAGRRGPQLH